MADTDDARAVRAVMRDIAASNQELLRQLPGHAGTQKASFTPLTSGAPPENLTDLLRGRIARRRMSVADSPPGSPPELSLAGSSLASGVSPSEPILAQATEGPAVDLLAPALEGEAALLPARPTTPAPVLAKAKSRRPLPTTPSIRGPAPATPIRSTSKGPSAFTSSGDSAPPAPPRRTSSIAQKIDRSGFFTSLPRGSTKKLGKKLAARKAVAKKKSATKASKKSGGTKRKRSDSATKKGTKKKKEKKETEAKKRKGKGKKRRLIAPDPPRFL